ncbi:glyoxylase-like metal-dependent hydrolase (beta-lactamase superfamily II) [Mucilaginibacter frigoritolerans]|uniref:Glyoxylase-like metal-dependent hydrolase (Beta-lactamase superfamily II) n=1 Tax=Mucilaginibacter frigoritolerans TaxID=652788 RepID=A0A562TRT9_9SPHI|nr:MBL fold metallo-hydrolase [Mucilaginibacter frigoritolerans]TWI95924.1 glyoxylase-like metal-dependent hydrolase (beta-lactamase superfamily II) [Mucilaginibacter frigoritolerans]
MIIQQFYDKGLAHGSYAVIRTGKMIVIDPARDPQPYYDFAKQHNADIVGVIETHPHADFVSSHLEIHQTTDAVIYVSKLTGAEYPHESFDDGDIIKLNDIKLKAINTPGHSPDSICILAEDENGKEQALFSGDTLFVGDVGRPDLRENVGNTTAKKEELARQMYHSTRDKLMKLPHNVVVYPAHGPGSLCGKNMSPDLQSTIGRELRENYALQLMDELQFIKTLTSDQPFVPKYFTADVELNKKGAPSFKESVAAVLKIDRNSVLDENILVIDTRPMEQFRSGHVKGAINLQDGGKFETWLGSIVSPTELFYLIGNTDTDLDTAIYKAAKIGYEQNIKGALLVPDNATEKAPELDINTFTTQSENYTVVDVRNTNETESNLIFNHADTIPLPELRERIGEIPTDKPIVVHCAAGYRSAAAASIIAAAINNVPVFDLSETIVDIQNKTLQVIG